MMRENRKVVFYLYGLAGSPDHRLFNWDTQVPGNGSGQMAQLMNQSCSILLLELAKTFLQVVAGECF